jgi:hypothetical protein
VSPAQAAGQGADVVPGTKCMTTIASPLDLWRSLCSSAGLELVLKGGRPGRDADVEVSLRSALGVPASARSLEAWLVSDARSPRPQVTVERLLIEVLKSQGGFAQMMQDILDVLITAEARQSSHRLSVEFRFDAVSDPIKATLEEFRETIERTRRVLERRPTLPSQDLMWSILRDLRGLTSISLSDPPQDFPLVPPIGKTGHRPLDDELERLALLVAAFRGLWRSHGSSRSEVQAAAVKLGRLPGASSKLTEQLFASTDYWDVSVLVGVEDISRQVISGQLDPADVQLKLTHILRDVEWTDVWVEHTMQELLDILNLPAWKRRHELYSVWVGTRMLKVIERVSAEVCFHAIDGVLSFDFGGSRLATFNWQGRQFDVWAELRSALVGISAKRKKGIQPDFRVVRADLQHSANTRTTYVLECKHYLNSSTSNFTQAAGDYAGSCPNAVVHVVNHGPADERALHAALPTGMQQRTRFIGNATPVSEVLTQTLGTAIQDALFPGWSPPLPSHPVPTLSTGTVGHVILEWDASLKDMDLALHAIGPDGQVAEEVNFRHLGSLDEPPFAKLLKDIQGGPGQERIDIGAWHYNRYAIVATNYSQAGEMGPANLRCDVVTSSGLTRLSCPASLGAGCFEWQVAELLVRNSLVTVASLGSP